MSQTMSTQIAVHQHALTAVVPAFPAEDRRSLPVPAPGFRVSGSVLADPEQEKSYLQTLR